MYQDFSEITAYCQAHPPTPIIHRIGTGSEVVSSKLVSSK